jgi:hypothetical protein
MTSLLADKLLTSITIFEIVVEALCENCSKSFVEYSFSVLLLCADR